MTNNSTVVIFKMKSLSKKFEYLCLLAGYLVVSFKKCDTWRSVWLSSSLTVGLLYYLYHLERSLTRRIKGQSSFQMRSESSGLWCAILLPFLLLCYYVKWQTESSDIYWIITLQSFTIVGPSIVTFNDVLRFSSTKASNLMWCLLGILVMQIFTNQGIFTSIYTTTFSHGLFICIINCIIKQASLSCTLGEASLMAHGMSLLLTYLPFTIYFFNTPSNEMVAVAGFVQIALCGCVIYATLLALCPILRTTILFYITGATVAGTVIVPLMWLHLNDNPLFWFYEYVMSSNTKIGLMLSYMAFLLIAILILAFQQYSGNKNKTVIRKYFHGVVLGIYIPGILYSKSFIFASSGIFLGIFSLFEMARVLKVPPFGRFLQKSFTVFLDEKDKGPLILTHIYLLIGTSIPVWLSPIASTNEPHLSLFSGVLAVGIGDTIAGIFGILYGRVKWPGSNKTVEGTLSSIVFQIISIVILKRVGVICPSFTRIIFATTLTSLLEAFTLQVDNLVLSLFMCCLLL